MTKALSWTRPLALLALFGVVTGGGAAEGLSGVLHDTQNQAVTAAFLALMSPTFDQIKQTAFTGKDGAFEFSRAEAGDHVVVQPPTQRNRQGINAFRLQPRVYRLGPEATVTLRLPPAGCFVLDGYDNAGKLMRVEDYLRAGSFGSVFCYVTDLEDQMKPAVSWWVHNEDSGFKKTRENGLPALAIEPGDDTYAVHVLFWEVPGYGKLMLRADNAGAGFRVGQAGECVVLELNVELARTAVADLGRRREALPERAGPEIDAIQTRLEEALSVADKPLRAAAANGVLAAALKLRDDLEYEAANAAIPRVRRGKVAIRVVGANGAALPGCGVQIRQRSHDFLFGIFEGSPYNAKAHTKAREAGFEMATVLLGWNWTEPANDDWDPIDEVFGVSALKALGFKVKAHGVIYLQGYGITPERAMAMDKAEVPAAILEHQRALLQSPLGKPIDLWEVINEAGVTNILGLPRADVIALTRQAASTIKQETGKPTLINSAHEIDFGRKYLAFSTDNVPLGDYALTYSDFLRQAADAGALEAIDTIGLQVYPGTHLSEVFGGIEGPAFTPAWLLDTIERYAARFDKPVHITEFSLPSSYGADWKCGYWRAPWNESVQAECADYVYTLAFGNPHVHSVTWWDFAADKPAVVTGSLVDKRYEPKPVLERLTQRFREWTTEASAETDPAGAATIEGYAGEYELTLTSPDGARVTRTFHISERETTALTVEVGSTS